MSGCWVDGVWTLGGRWVDGTKKNGNGRWTGWSRKVDGMVTEGGWDGHGRWTVSGQKRKIYCTQKVYFSEEKTGPRQREYVSLGEKLKSNEKI